MTLPRNGMPMRPGAARPAGMPPPPPVMEPLPEQPSVGHGMVVKIGLLIGLLILGKVASLAQRGAVGTAEMRLYGIIIGELLVLIVSLLNVNFSFYVLVFYLPFSQMMAGDYGTAINIANVLIVVVIFGLFFRSVREGGHFFEKTELDGIIGLYFLLVFVSFFRASLQETIDWFILVTLVKRFITPLFLYYLTSWVVKDRQQIQDCVYIMMLTTLMVAFLATKDTVTPTHFAWERREAGVVSQANNLAAFFLYYMFLFFSYFTLNAGNPRFWLLLVCLYPCGRAIMLTFSRGGYVAFVVQMLFITLIWKRSVFIATAVFMLFMWNRPELILPGAAVERIKGSVITTREAYGEQGVRVEESAQGRLNTWKGGLRMVLSNPLLGVGYGQFPLLIGSYVPSESGRDAHNAYLLIAAEMGIPALVIYLWITIRLFRYAMILYRFSPDKLYAGLGLGYATGVVGFWVANFFGCRFNTTETISYFWIIAALIVLIRKLPAGPIPAFPQPPPGARNA